MREWRCGGVCGCVACACGTGGAAGVHGHGQNPGLVACRVLNVGRGMYVLEFECRCLNGVVSLCGRVCARARACKGGVGVNGHGYNPGLTACGRSMIRGFECACTSLISPPATCH